MAKPNTDAHEIAALILALSPELALAQCEDRRKRLRAAATMISGAEPETRNHLIRIICITMRISETVFRQIMAEQKPLPPPADNLEDMPL